MNIYDCSAAKTSRTVITFVILEGWIITAASMGDSRCISESAEGDIYYLSTDHRLECSKEEYVSCPLNYHFPLVFVLHLDLGESCALC